MSSRFSPLALRLFELAFTPWRRRRIHDLLLAGLPPGLPPGRPLLVVANHVSWWDAFLLREAHRALRPHAPIYTVMLRDELFRFPFFAALGAVGIDPRSAGSLRRALRLLRARLDAHPEAVVLFFPQGRIWPSRRRPLGFRRGVELFARELAPLTVLPVGIHLEPLTAPSPTAFLSAGEPLEVTRSAPAAETLERAVREELDAIHALLDRAGEEAPALWPGVHDRLERAGAGDGLRAAR